MARPHSFACAVATASQKESFFGNKLQASLVFGSLEPAGGNSTVRRRKLDVVFGSIELDLSGASISSPDRRAALEANAVFGGIEITVPAPGRL